MNDTTLIHGTLIHGTLIHGAPTETIGPDQLGNGLFVRTIYLNN